MSYLGIFSYWVYTVYRTWFNELGMHTFMVFWLFLLKRHFYVKCIHITWQHVCIWSKMILYFGAQTINDSHLICNIFDHKKFSIYLDTGNNHHYEIIYTYAVTLCPHVIMCTISNYMFPLLYAVCWMYYTSTLYFYPKFYCIYSITKFRLQ